MAGCGAIPPASGSDASGSRTTSTPAQSPSPPANPILAAGNCTGSAAGLNSTITKPLGMDSITLAIPRGWSDQTSVVTGVSALLRIQAPSSYGPDDAIFELDLVPGPRRGSSSHEQAAQDAAGPESVGLQVSVADCSVGGQASSFYWYQDSSGNQVYKLFVLHSPSSRYPFLYAVEIASKGPIDPQAATDVRGILASWTWGSPTYDPNT